MDSVAFCGEAHQAQLLRLLHDHGADLAVRQTRGTALLVKLLSHSGIMIRVKFIVSLLVISACRRFFSCFHSIISAMSFVPWTVPRGFLSFAPRAYLHAAQVSI